MMNSFDVNMGRLLRVGLLTVACALQLACQGTQVVEERPVNRAIDDILVAAATQSERQSTAATSGEQAAVADILLAGDSTASTQNRAPAERFDITVSEVSAEAFFFGLVADTGYNMVVHPGVKGSLSLNLKSVTVDEVMRVVRDVYGYEFRLRNNIYTVFPRELRTQVFKIDYLDIQRIGISDTSVLIGQISSDDDDSDNDNGGSNNNSSAGEDDSNSGISQGARIQTLNSTDFWSGLRDTILAMIGGRQGDRTVVVNPHAGLIVVKAMPAELNDIREFLERSELSVQRQVILETKILEVRLNDSFEAGINWGEISGLLSLQSVNVSDGSIEEVFSSSARREHVFSSVLNVTDITRLLSLLETQGDVQVLSSPRVSTVNNQKALIRVGSDEFFITGISNDTVSNASSTVTTPNIELSSFFSGIALDVTPQIADDGDVILHIHPVVSEVRDQLKNFTVGSSDFEIPLAQRQIRESDSVVKAGNGQVVVLGGLMQEQTNNLNGKRPVIGDIPVVNSLFKTRAESTTKTELVILMRPIVVDSDDDWQREIQSSQQRLRSAYP